MGYYFCAKLAREGMYVVQKSKSLLYKKWWALGSTFNQTRTRKSVALLKAKWILAKIFGTCFLIITLPFVQPRISELAPQLPRSVLMFYS